MDTNIKNNEEDPDKRWITTWNDYLVRIKYFFRWLYNYKDKDLDDVPFSEWEKNLNNIQFKNIKNNKDADLEIKIKNGNSDQEGGQAVIYFDNKGFIDNVEISVSKSSNGLKLDGTIIEHITKHEIGHDLVWVIHNFPILLCLQL